MDIYHGVRERIESLKKEMAFDFEGEGRGHVTTSNTKPNFVGASTLYGIRIQHLTQDGLPLIYIIAKSHTADDSRYIITFFPNSLRLIKKYYFFFFFFFFFFFLFSYLFCIYCDDDEIV